MPQEQATGDVITEEQPTGDGVTVDDGQTGGDVIADEGGDTPTDESGQEDTDVQSMQTEDYWKNRAMELERKQQNLASSLPDMIEKELVKRQQDTGEKQPQYTIEQLEQYAIENPQYRPWVEQQKETIREKRMEERIRKMHETESQKQKADIERQQAYNAVTGDPAYSEAFITVNGQKQWNPQSPLAVTMNEIMQDPRVKDDPRAIQIAAELAFGRLAKQGQINVTSKIQNLKKQNQVLKKATLTEGGGVSAAPAKKDAFVDAQSRLSQSGRKEDAQAAVSAYFAKHRR